MSAAGISALSLHEAAPPAHLSPALQALWWDAKGQWREAHDLVAEDPSPDAAWVHAYLHRREGDEGNAAYWYARAGRARSGTTLQEEWTTIATALTR